MSLFYLIDISAVLPAKHFKQNFKPYEVNTEYSLTMN